MSNSKNVNDDHGRHELSRDIELLEERFRESAKELGALRAKLQSGAKDEWTEIRQEWDVLDGRVRTIGIALGVALFLGAYLFYMNLGWYADQRSLPQSSDWLLDRLPAWNLVPLLSWGWLALHTWALAIAVLYYPRRMPFLLVLLSVYLGLRTLYVFLSPIGAPTEILDMRQLDTLFALVAGEYTFQNEFIFSGHTAVPFLFYLFFDSPRQKAVMLAGSLCMAFAVLVTRNHYTVDVLSAYLIGYSIYALSQWLFGLAKAQLPRAPHASVMGKAPSAPTVIAPSSG
jgi:hypothetical protein